MFSHSGFIWEFFCCIPNFPLATNKKNTLHKDEVPVPILTMVDDALSMAECGLKASEINTYLNTEEEEKGPIVWS